MVRAGPGVGRVFGVSGGGAVSRPIKMLRFVLREQAQRIVLEATVELSCNTPEIHYKYYTLVTLLHTRDTL